MADPVIGASWDSYCRDLYAQVHFFKESSRYHLFAPGNLGKGDFNVYRMFVETAFLLVRPGGRAAQFVPENLYNGPNATAIRKEVFERWTLDWLLGFENAKEVWFRDVDTRAKFCVYAACKGGSTDLFRAAFGLRSESGLAQARAGAALKLPISLVREFSPDAMAVMELSSQKDIDIARKMYAAWPKFGNVRVGPPNRTYMAELHMGNDRDFFTEDPSGFPVYEGRMVDQFEYRAKGYRSGRGRAAEWEDLPFGSPGKSIQPQWYVAAGNVPSKLGGRHLGYRVGFCDVASPTNERTLIACLIPPHTLCGHKVPTITFEPTMEWAYATWLAIANGATPDMHGSRDAGVLGARR